MYQLILNKNLKDAQECDRLKNISVRSYYYFEHATDNKMRQTFIDKTMS